MYRHRSSPPPTILEQYLETVGRLCKSRRKLEITGPAGCPPHLERFTANRNNLRDWRVAVEDGERPAFADRPQMFAEAGLQVRYSNGAHD